MGCLRIPGISTKSAKVIVSLRVGLFYFISRSIIGKWSYPAPLVNLTMFPSLSLYQVTPIANAKVTWNAFSAAGAVGHKCLTAMVQATAEKTTAIECLSLAPPLIIWARNHTMSVKEIAVCIRLTFPYHTQIKFGISLTNIHLVNFSSSIPR